LVAFAGDPNENCTAVIQSGGDKEGDELLRIGQGKSGSEFGNVFEVLKGSLAEVFDLSLRG